MQKNWNGGALPPPAPVVKMYKVYKQRQTGLKGARREVTGERRGRLRTPNSLTDRYQLPPECQMLKAEVAHKDHTSEETLL